MLMSEIASAADTLELWKLVNDSVWASLQKLQREEQERKAAQRKAAAVKRAKRVPRAASSTPTSTRKPPTVSPAPPAVAQPPKPQQVARAAAVPSVAQTQLGLQHTPQAPISLSQKQT